MATETCAYSLESITNCKAIVEKLQHFVQIAVMVKEERDPTKASTKNQSSHQYFVAEIDRAISRNATAIVAATIRDIVPP